MICCGPSRRTLLGAAALGTLAGLTGYPAAGRAQGMPVTATDLELVTVTESSAVFTWTTVRPDASGRLSPVAAQGEAKVIPSDGGPVTVVGEPAATPFHHVEVTGLEPGRRYRFEAWSQGTRATPALNLTSLTPGSPEATGEFTTLTPPPGRLLRTIALAADLHYGETVSGLIVGDLPPGFRQLPELPPYPEVMLSALLADVRAPDRAAQRLLIAGDLTAEATPEQTRSVRAALDDWGVRGQDYLAVRGNHDRPHTGTEYAACTPVTSDHHDCFADSFSPRQELIEHDLGGLRIIGLDTSELDGSGGRIERPQFERLARLLREDPDRPTLVFGHHPVTRESGFTNVAGPGFVLNSADSAELQRLYTRAPGVFLHYAGHTHRNRRTMPDAECAVEFLEVAAVKEYPGGYCLLRVYEGGYTVNFHTTRTTAARQWSATTRGEYFGLLPDYALGTTADRNHVVLRDFSGLR